MKDQVNSATRVKRVLVVCSCKGGVGKSFVAANLAAYFSAKRGLKVGFLDADVCGPCAPRMLGVIGEDLFIADDRLYPVISEYGVMVASVGLCGEGLLECRGPLKSRALGELIEGLAWGNLDLLIVDSPPGTGDELLTLAEALPRERYVVLVVAPSMMAAEVSLKTVRAARKLGFNVVGAIVNMAYTLCPRCGSKIYVLGDPSECIKALREEDVELLAEVPLEHRASVLADEGKAVAVEEPSSPAGRALVEAAERILERLKLA